ncbi:Tim44 domain-containing protein [Geomesophilobacter sediminis]|uniref:Tim44 domain-containing protein n=1 Tax=Geomesophilobacter sediminis TaxID=2798584 RepID=A0A8J7S940_9BACT|nr:Tim44 domain-containing protein [Geomesophilobacter sediminis]MBJ6727957.1 Tim44 domain-containing protein [Geomesophilobacter sediminis]
MNNKNKGAKIFAVLAAVLMMSVTVMELNAEARAGSSRSAGSRGSRSYSRPAASSPYYQPSPMRQPAPPISNRYQQPAGGGFLRSMAGGLVGGMLGGMLFRSMGMAGGMGGMGGGGIGLFEIILLAGIGYLIYRFVKSRRQPAAAASRYQGEYQAGGYPSGYQDGNQDVTQPSGSYRQVDDSAAGADLENGIAQLRQMDPHFDAQRFSDNAMDIFFKIQGAWMNRDLAPVAGVLTAEMRGILQEDVSRLLRERQVNRLENIAVRKVEIAEVWQEGGQDYVTALIQANLLDYTTDETGTVLSGSKSDPVKFQEYWTFTRPVGDNPWTLSAIQQQ